LRSRIGAAGRQRPALAVFVVALALTAAARAETRLEVRDEIDFDRPEAWGMKYAAAVAASTALSAEADLPSGAVETAIEVATVPSLSTEERRLGFVGTKVEDIDRPTAFGRLRWRFGLPRGWILGLGVVPPIRLEGLEPRIISINLGRRLFGSARLRLAARAVAQHAEIRGDITCSAADVAAGDDPAANPFRCEQRSHDTVTLDTGGFELTATAVRSGHVEPYVGIAIHRLDASFQVDARYAGLRDRTRLDTAGWLGWATVGAGRVWSSGWRAAGEVQYAPLSFRRPGEAASNRSVANFRLLVAKRQR